MQHTAKTILCIEDEGDLRENITYVLRQEGYNTVEAVDGQDGLAKFLEVRPDLILCDINMPNMNGHELLTKVRIDYPETIMNIPFIFLTAFGQKDDLLKGLSLGVDEYVVKPVDFDVLLTLIKNKLDRSDTHTKLTQKKLDKFCEQVSTLIPNEVKEPLENIIRLSATLKNETLGAFVDPKYTDYASKIYLSALKLNMQVSRALSGDRISEEIRNIKDNISVQDLFSDLEKIFKDKGVEFILHGDIPTLRLNKESFLKALISYLTQHLNAKAKNISLNAFLDYKNNLVIAVISETPMPIVSEALEFVLTENNSRFSVQTKEGRTYHMMTFPKYLLKQN